jgi:hypothetical protein
MSCQECPRGVLRHLAGAVLLLALSPVGLCQSAPPTDDSEPAPEETEEIIVYGEMNLIHLKYETYRTEEAFLDLFNSLNTNDEFDFNCESVTSLETRRRRHTCTPKFYSRILSRVSMETAMGMRNRITAGDLNQLVGPTKARIERKEQELATEMLALLAENAELRAAYRELSAAKEAYEARNEERRAPEAASQP